MALSAAGIEADVERAPVSLDPEVEAVLAWAVREGATNVIRHSGARHCTFRISASSDDAGGRGGRRRRGPDGSGAGGRRRGVVARGASCRRRRGARRRHPRPGGRAWRGLAERAGSDGRRGRALAGGGFRLAVTVPVARA